MTICKHGVDSQEATCANCQNAQHRKAGLRTRKAIAWLSRILAPLFGYYPHRGCVHCGIHWAVVPWHDLELSEGTGCTILCEGCWRDLPTSKKIEYYKAHKLNYEARNPGMSYGFTYKEIEMAVKYPHYWKNNSGMFLSFEECD